MLDRFARSLRDREPDRRGAGGGGRRAGGAAEIRRRGGRGRRGGAGAGGRREPDRADPGPRARAGSPSSPTSTRFPTRARSRWSRENGVFRSARRHDPGRRQQGGGDGADGARGPPRRRSGAARPRAGLHRRRGGRAARRQGARHLRAAGARSASCSTTPRPIGEVIVAAPTYKRLIAEFTGHEAHAGINPEDGHSAIAAAAAAVAEMKLGRLDEETTANVGMIEGGTASNVVAGHCRILGEARSVDGERAAATIGEMVDACTWAAGEQGCDVDAQVIEMFRGYRLDPKSEAVRDRLGGAAAARPRAGAGRDRRRQRRERAGRVRLRGGAARQRDRGEPHAGGAGHRGARSWRCSRSCEAAVAVAAGRC